MLRTLRTGGALGGAHRSDSEGDGVVARRAATNLVLALALGSDEGSGATGMIVTVRVADSGVWDTFPKAKPLLARRRRKKIWGQSAVLLNFEWFLSG